MEWLSENWFAVLIFSVFIFMHLFGHGHHGMHGHGGHDHGKEQKQNKIQFPQKHDH